MMKSMGGKFSSSHNFHHSRLMTPPPAGSGRCWSCPAAVYGPICFSRRPTSSSPNRSGHSNSPGSVRQSFQPMEV